jgi:hypothetical protein
MLSIIKRKNPTYRENSMPPTLNANLIAQSEMILAPLQKSVESRRGERKLVTSANSLAQGITVLSTTSKFD